LSRWASTQPKVNSRRVRTAPNKSPSRQPEVTYQNVKIIPTET
jgi:hypothetical protein